MPEELRDRFVIKTPRLRLRPFLSSDLSPYASANADPDVMRFLGGRISREESDRQAFGANASLGSAGFGKIAIERTNDAAFLGMCGLSREHWFPDDLELGWRLLPQYVGHGYATEAGKAWLDYAFAVLKVPRVISIAEVTNHKSVAVMERIGMSLNHVTELDDHGERFSAVVYSIASSV